MDWLKKLGQTDFTKALLYKFIYRLAAVGFKRELPNIHSLKGMGYYIETPEHYLRLGRKQNLVRP